jgi:hypothetical protein
MYWMSFLHVPSSRRNTQGISFLSMCSKWQFAIVQPVSWRKRLQYRISPLTPFSFLASLPAPFR